MNSFDEVQDRSQNNAAKLDEMEGRFGYPSLIPLWVADMDFRAPEAVIDAIRNRNEQGICGYTSRPKHYYEAVQCWYHLRYGFEFDLSQMVHSPTVMTSISLLIQELTQPDDKILIMTPVYPPFFDVVKGHKRTLITSSLKRVLKENRAGARESVTWEMDFEDLDLKLSGVKVLLLCNPHNPVGRVWSREALAQLGALCVKHDVKIFADEIHGEFVFSDHPYTPMATVSEAAAAQTTTLLSASKTFNLAGLHASFAVFGNPGDQSVFERALGLLDLKRNNCFSLVAVEAAYSGGAKWLEALKEYIEDNLNFVCGEIHKRIPELSVTMPEGTYLLWIDCNGLGLTDEALARFMAEKAGLALGAGISYGQEGSGYMRMNAACSRSVLEQALGKLEEAVRALK